MDNQTKTHSNAANLIPVNTRTVGTPEGIYILYLEDYVHTFMKKILSEKKAKTISYGTDAEYQIEKNIRPDIALYGKCIEESGRYRLVISGAAALESSDKVAQCNDTYFPSCVYVGMACICYNKDSKLRIELTLRNTKVILDDFYIYYDQNEEMQNYLIEWNNGKEKDEKNEHSDITEQRTRVRNHSDDAARLGRIAQAYNREEAKVSFMWNVMNILCLGFVVCIMAYGITSVNNYNKMQNMQEKIDYCMAFVEENTSFQLTQTDETQAVETMQQTGGLHQEGTSAQQEQKPQETSTQQEMQEEMQQTQAAAQGDTQTAYENNQNEENQNEEPAQSLAEAQTVSEPETISVQNEAQTQPKQYYIVRKGDTLRTICYDIYGDYSRVEEICQFNHIEDPDNILYGQKLLLP